MPVSLVFDAGSEDSYPETAFEQMGARPDFWLVREILIYSCEVSRTREVSLVEVRSISTYS
jgi:hypothetical protein